MTLREITEERERKTLSPFAALSVQSEGRLWPIEPCPIRTCYQRDRDRIIHCKSFRRLKHKTQVFLSPEGDHYRTRLTHTLEVSQIARAIARALPQRRPDRGGGPRSRSGPHALRPCRGACLDALLPHGFRHYEQSLRVVDRLEKEGRGLNFSYEVRNGILCHTGPTGLDAVRGASSAGRTRSPTSTTTSTTPCAGASLREEDIPSSIPNVLGNSDKGRITSLIRWWWRTAMRGGRDPPVDPVTYAGLWRSSAISCTRQCT